MDDNSITDRVRKKEKRRRLPADRDAHAEKHQFRGPMFKTKKVPFFISIGSETPPITVVMWTMISMTWATSGWFACSFFGYTLCRKWKNIPPQGESANLEFIFSSIPLNRWAVNLAASFGMLVFFALETMIFMSLRISAYRKRQIAHAMEENYLVNSSDEVVEMQEDPPPRDSTPPADPIREPIPPPQLHVPPTTIRSRATSARPRSPAPRPTAPAPEPADRPSPPR